MIGKRNKRILVFACVIIVGFGLFSFIPEVDAAATTFFTLTGVVPDNKLEAIDSMNFIKQHLARIGINLDIVIAETSGFIDIDTQYETRDFDLKYVEYDELTLSNMINSLYRENGSRNIFGYDITMDYSEPLGTGKNEWLIKQFNSILPADSQERFDICWEWQFYLMNELLPCFPLFGDNDSIVMLAFNMREVRSQIGSRAPCPLDPTMTMGLAIRKAIVYAINKEFINEFVHRNKSIEIDHPILPSYGNWLHPNIIRYCHNTDVAIAYMKLAGWDLGWCGTNNPPHPHTVIPDWEDVCDPNFVYPLYTEPTNSSYKYFSLLIFLLPVIIVIIFSIFKWRKKS